MPSGFTSTTQQSKLSARGPITEEFANLTFARPADTVRLDWLGRVAKNQDEAIGLIGSGNSIEELSERRFAQFAREAYENVVAGSSDDLQLAALNIVRGDKASKYSQEAQDLAGRVKGYLDEFKEYQFSADDLDEFTGFKIKIVSSGTNEALSPRFKDFRALALA